MSSASRMALMSSMMVELTNTISSWDQDTKIVCTKRHFFQLLLRNKKKTILVPVELQKLGINRHSPCNYRSELGTSDVLQSENMLPWMNQSEVQQWWDLQAVWWFFHRSEADSHPKIFPVSCHLLENLSDLVGYHNVNKWLTLLFD